MIRKAGLVNRKGWSVLAPGDRPLVRFDCGSTQTKEGWEGGREGEGQTRSGSTKLSTSRSSVISSGASFPPVIMKAERVSYLAQHQNII